MATSMMKMNVKRTYYLTLRNKRLASVAAALVMLDDEDEKKRLWKKPWLGNHHQQGAYPNLLKELELSDIPSYVNYLRMGPEQFKELAQKIEPYIARQDTNFRKSVPTEERLAVTLRFLATGESYKSLGYSFRLGSTTIGMIVPETCQAIYHALKEDYLQMPQSPQDWLSIAKRFMEKWNFPNTLGAIDGKHVALRAPQYSGSMYYNYKHFFSIVLMALVDADYKFIYVDIGCNGRISDGGIFAGCSLTEALNNHLINIPAVSQLPGGHGAMSYHIIGDEAFPLREDLMKPFPFRNMTKEQRIFNYRLSRARRVVENAFGILCSRFRVFLNRISLEPQRVESLVLCACTLHNYLIAQNDRHYVGHGMLDEEDTITHTVTDGTWRTDQILESTGLPHSNNGGLQPKQKRLKLMAFCNSPEGSLSWQDTMV